MMVEPVVLVENAKEFFEEPAFLLGIPLVVLGIIGLLIVLSPAGVRRARPPAESGALAEEGAPAEVVAHPSGEQYVRVGIILAAVTAVEVAVYYLGLAQGALLGILLVLSGLKFALVALWFMHLQFDSRVFSTLFAGGLALVLALFIVVLATLGASLV